MTCESCDILALKKNTDRELAGLLLMLGGGASAQALDGYNVDPKRISVSGLSSGAYMAVQLHVAYSETFMGVGALAGGPFYCAGGNMMDATGRCMDSPSQLPSASYFRDLTSDEDTAGRIDPVANMDGDRVWLFTGTNDDTVRTGVSDVLNDYYGYYTDAANIVYERNELNAGHGYPTEDFGVGCTQTASPYLNNCNYDAAGEVLKHLQGELNYRQPQEASNLQTFDQGQFTDSFYVGNEGFIYIPTTCQDGNECSLHVALHGCLQNRDDIGDDYARNAGYNEWAEANGIIVLYPQTSTSATNSCWDWWGYADSNYHNQNGPQMQFVKAIVDEIAGGDGSGGDDDDGDDGSGGDDGNGDGGSTDLYCGTDTNANHDAAERAYETWSYYYAEGSDEYMGFGGSGETKLEETSAGYFEIVDACPTDDDGGDDGSEDDGWACQDYGADNYTHVQEDRAWTDGSYAYAEGSDESMGLYNTYAYTDLAEVSDGYFEIGTCE